MFHSNRPHYYYVLFVKYLLCAKSYISAILLNFYETVYSKYDHCPSKILKNLSMYSLHGVETRF